MFTGGHFARVLPDPGSGQHSAEPFSIRSLRGREGHLPREQEKTDWITPTANIIDLVSAWELHFRFSPTLSFQTDQLEGQQTDQH